MSDPLLCIFCKKDTSDALYFYFNPKEVFHKECLAAAIQPVVTKEEYDDRIRFSAKNNPGIIVDVDTAENYIKSSRSIDDYNQILFIKTIILRLLQDRNIDEMNTISMVLCHLSECIEHNKLEKFFSPGEVFISCE